MEHEVRTTATSNQTRKGIDLDSLFDLMTPLELVEMLFNQRFEAVARLSNGNKHETNSNNCDAMLFESAINQLRSEFIAAKSGN